MTKNNSKLRLLKLYELLKCYSDENNVLTTTQLIDLLQEKENITTDRRTLYNDIDILIENGYDIMKIKSNPNAYYVAGHDFENAEIKCLMDLVESSQMLTREISEKLKKKLSALTSKYFANELTSSIIENKKKTKNKKVLYYVDTINNCILEEKEIEFLYYKYDYNLNKYYKNNKNLYNALPLSICIEDGKYYLSAIHNNIIKNFRIDKMDNLNISKNPEEYQNSIKHKDLSKIKNHSFYMYTGKECLLELEVLDKDVCDILIDRFDNAIKFIRKQEKIIAQINIMISPILFAWLTCLGDKIKLISPKSEIENFKTFLNKASLNYIE